MVACLFVYQQITYLKEFSGEKKEAIKTVAKNFIIVIGGIILTVLLFWFMRTLVGR